MTFSARTSWDLRESELTVAIAQARCSNPELLDLTIANPTTCGFAYDTAAILDALCPAALGHSAVLRYDPDPRGIASAREAVAMYYAGHQAQIDPDNILLTTSTSEAYSYLFRLLCDPGDRILVAQPSYPLFDFIAGLDHVQLDTYPTFYDFGWCIDFAALEQAIGPRTRALVLVHPNNPTGHATRPAELAQLQALCARHSMALIVDEVFLDYGLDGPIASVAALAQPETLTFILSGLSKVAALPQLKVGWVACLGPDALRRGALARLEVIADTFLSMNAPAQHALPAWLATAPAMQRQIRERLLVNRDAAAGLRHVSALPVEAGWSLILRLPQRAAGHSLARRLVAEAGLILHPGSFYGMRDHFLVASTLTPAEIFVQGINLLERWWELEG